jgi:hypothetical protein
VASSVDVGSEVAIPKCGTGQFPCWRIDSKLECQDISTGFGLTVDRNGAPPPANTFVRASCTPPSK